MGTRLSVNINGECAAAFQELAKRHDTTVTEIVRRAISLYKYVDDQTREGCQLQLVNEAEVITIKML